MVTALRHRIDELERKVGTLPPPGGGPTPADEVREIDREIKRLEAEIAEAQASMTPEGLARNRAEHEEFMKTLDGLELDEQIEALSANIAAIEAAIEAEEEEGIR